MRRTIAYAATLFLSLAGCSKVQPESRSTTAALGSEEMSPPAGDGGVGGGGGDSGPDQGPLPDMCQDGLVNMCDENSCFCGTPPADTTCDAKTDCTDDSGCGDGSCCYHGSCIAKSGSCQCGDSEVAMSSSASPGCPDSGGFVDMVKQQANYICQQSAPYFGNRCTMLGQCIGSAAIDDVDMQCFDNGDDQIAGMSVAVCYHCDEADPPDVPPDNEDECDDLQAQISNKKIEITLKNKDIAYLTDGIAKLDAVIAREQAFIDGMADAESKIINGYFGDNIFFTTAGKTTKMVTDIYSGAKLFTAAKNGACLAQRTYCKTNLVGKVPQMSWKMTVFSKRAWGEVYSPAVDFGMARVTGLAAGGGCPADPPDNSWFSWWPGLDSAQWFVGCATKEQAVQQVGENRLNAIGSRNGHQAQRAAMSAQRDQALQDLGVLNAALKALQDQWNEKCGCNHP